MYSATVLIPAYNEGTVISRTLRDLTKDMRENEFQIIVIANACRDDTVEQAKASYPPALVLDIPEGGKTNAMNVGYLHAKSAVIVCLDADLSVPAQNIRKLIRPISNGECIAVCGRMVVDLAGCSWTVRAFYSAWMANPYFLKGKFGGLWALSRTSADKLFPLPKITADDEFVSRSFSNAEKGYVEDCSFIVRAPKDIRSLVKIRTRSRRGTRQLSRMGLFAERKTGAGSFAHIVKANWAKPRKWHGLVVYAAIMIWVRLRLYFEQDSSASIWERDESTRKSS